MTEDAAALLKVAESVIEREDAEAYFLAVLEESGLENGRLRRLAQLFVGAVSLWTQERGIAWRNVGIRMTRDRHLAVVAVLIAAVGSSGCGGDWRFWRVERVPGARWALEAGEELQAGRCEGALAVLRAVEEDARDGGWYSLLAMSASTCTLRSGRREFLEEGLAAMRRGEQKFPDDPMVRLWHGCLLEDAGDPRAHEKLTEARRLAEPGHGRGVGRDVLRTLDESKKLRRSDRESCSGRPPGWSPTAPPHGARP